MASGEHSRAEAINNRGEVVGVAGDRPFIWTASTGAEPFLGDLVGTALDINDRGEVVGRYATAGPPGGFLWSRQSGFVDLGDFIPYEINEQGQIAGQCSPTAEACIWDEGAITRLGNLGASGSVGLGIDDAGEVVGYSNTRGRVTHPFLWTPLAGMIDLGAADQLPKRLRSTTGDRLQATDAAHSPRLSGPGAGSGCPIPAPSLKAWTSNESWCRRRAELDQRPRVRLGAARSSPGASRPAGQRFWSGHRDQ